VDYADGYWDIFVTFNFGEEKLILEKVGVGEVEFDL